MKKTLKRILAVCGILLLLGLVGITLFFAVTGSPYFLASMVSMIILPVLAYGYMIVYRAISPSDQKDDGRKEETENK